MKNLFLFFFLGTFISGFYPALVLSRFKPTDIFRKGLSGKRNSKTTLRKSLVTLQFATSIILIAATLVVNMQVKYMTTSDKGMTTENVVGFERPRVRNEEQAKNFEAFREELKNSTAVLGVGGTSNLPGGGGSDINSTTSKFKILELTDFVAGSTYLQFNDDGFIDALDIQILEGRNFDRERASDSSAIMVNESFLRKMNIADKAEVIGKLIQWGDSEDADRYEIIGVVNDFTRTSLKSNIEPTVYLPWLNPSEVIVKLDSDKYLEGISFIENKWKEFYPDSPLEFKYLEDRYARLYENDTRFGYVFGTFSVLALFISILGLFGLASFLAVQRTREIGIRRVLGASTDRIISLFFKDYLSLLSLAALVAIPVVYYTLDSWLESYAFHIGFPWISPVIALISVSIIALGVVAALTYRVASLNPATTLKHE